jgi:hypothetical protein
MISGEFVFRKEHSYKNSTKEELDNNCGASCITSLDPVLNLIGSYDDCDQNQIGEPSSCNLQTVFSKLNEIKELIIQGNEEYCIPCGGSSCLELNDENCAPYCDPCFDPANYANLSNNFKECLENGGNISCTESAGASSCSSAFVCLCTTA